MKKTIIVFVAVAGLTGCLSAEEFKKWTFSIPGYNMGTSYSYYQPLLGDFNNELSWLELDAANRRVVTNPAFIFRYSITPNLQIGLHFNAQTEQWEKREKSGTSTDTITNTQRNYATLTSYLPTAVLVYGIPIGKGSFSLGAGVGYYLINYKGGQDTITIIDSDKDGKADTTSSGTIFSADMPTGTFGSQVFLEFTYPIYRIFYVSIRAGYVFCVPAQSVTIVGKGSNYYLPSIDLSGVLGTFGFTVEF